MSAFTVSTKTHWHRHRITIAFGLLALFTGAAGMMYQYNLTAVLSYMIGNAILQVSIVMGIMMLMMGVVCMFQVRLKGRLVEWFIAIELLIALLGGFAPIVLQWLFVKSPDNIDSISYLYAAVIGFLIGIEIPIIMRLNETFTKDVGHNIAGTWSLDYFGSVAGSAIFIVALLKFSATITNISFLTAMVNIAVVVIALVFFWGQRMLRGRITKSLLLSATAVTALITFVGFSHSDSLERLFTQKLYDDPVIFQTTTPYQNIVMTQGPHPSDPFGYNYELYLNGNKQFASADEAKYHEYLVHPAMNTAVSRQRVLILGGGDGMALREVLKYDDVQDVTLVDLDPAMIELASTNEILRELNDDAFADARVHSNLNDEQLSASVVDTGETHDVWVDTGERKNTGCEEIDRGNGPTAQCPSEPVLEKVATVNVYTLDADKFISAATGLYDVIIVDLPDPNSNDLAKLYSEEFYSKLHGALSPDGIITVQGTSPYHAKEAYLCIMRTMTAAGLNVLPYHDEVPSFGDWGWIMGSPALPADDLYEHVDTMESFGVDTKVVDARGLTRALIFDKGQLESTHTEISTVMDPVVFQYYVREAWRTY